MSEQKPKTSKIGEESHMKPASRRTEIIFEDTKDKDSWDKFVTAHEEANFLQAWDFYEFHRDRGNKIVRRIAKRDGEIIAAYAGVVEAARRGRYLAIAGGPILDWRDSELVETVFKDMRHQGEQENCVFVRVRPQLELSSDSLTLMKQLGLKKAPMYLSVEYAGVLDLSKNEEEIKKACVNVCAEHSVKLRKLELSSRRVKIRPTFMNFIKFSYKLLGVMISSLFRKTF